ncbi:MAG: hypothetical protein Q7S18_02545 [bacterium]|nr:hypothetical protein [bacterium]
MSLDELEKKLYKPDSGIENRAREANPFDITVSPFQSSVEISKEKAWEKNEGTEKTDWKKILKIGGIALGSILFIAILIVAFVKYGQSAFKEEKITFQIEGLDEVNSSEEAVYKIVYKNDNRVDLKNVQILLNYSENFKPKEDQNLTIENPSNSRIDLGTIKAYSGGEADISGTFFAAKNAIVYLNATLRYTPSNFNSVFDLKKQLGVNVKSSPLFLELDAPAEVSNGNKVDYVVNYRNSSAEYFDGLRLKMVYADGFYFISASSAPSEGNNIWYLGSLKPGESGKIVITGTIQGNEDESKIVEAYIGYSGESGEFVAYDQKERSSKITSSLLSISQSVNGGASLNFNPGEVLRYSVHYKNNGNISLKDAIVTVEINSRVLDFSKLDSAKGSYNASNKTITWRAAEISGLANLAPGDGGDITFSIPVLDRIPVENPNDKNFTAVTLAKIDSPSIPTPIGSNKVIASNQMELKLNSRVVLDVKGYHQDLRQENSGPIPPKVGAETSYTIHWKIINVSNDIGDVKVISSLPSGVKWLGNVYPSGEPISFNERTNQIEWTIGNLKSGAGILDSGREAAFGISVTPEVNQVGKELLLLNSSTLTAKDLFTNADVKIEAKEKDNSLPEDASIGNGYKVEQ